MQAVESSACDPLMELLPCHNANDKDARRGLTEGSSSSTRQVGFCTR